MTLQWIGGLLIVLSCGGIGFAMALHDKKEWNCLKQLEMAASYMISELNCNMTPLPALLKRTAMQCSGILGSYFHLLSEELESQIAPDVSCCVSAALARCQDLPRKSRDMLIRMGQTMGQFDLEGQIRGLQGIIDSCQELRRIMEIDRPQRLRSYPTLGLCVGAVIAILFL